MFTIVFSLFYSIRQGLRSTAATDRACALLMDFCGFGSHNSRVAGDTGAGRASDEPSPSPLGSAAHSRRTAQAGFRSLGKECLAMDPARSERSWSRQAIADVSRETIVRPCGDGLLHRANAHVRCSILLFRYQPRPA